jgi:hypothetical protein
MPNTNINHIHTKQDNPMNFIRRILKPTSTTKLGRWQLHYDPKIVNSKVDQANEDHCGCCGEQMHQRDQREQVKQMKDKQQKQKWQEKKQQALMKKYHESENYYIPYVM